jgi:hypothetical protein
VTEQLKTELTQQRDNTQRLETEVREQQRLVDMITLRQTLPEQSGLSAQELSTVLQQRQETPDNSAQVIVFWALGGLIVVLIVGGGGCDQGCRLEVAIIQHFRNRTKQKSTSTLKFVQVL